MSDEEVALVDEDDNEIGTAPRSRMRAEILWHRATYVFVMSSDKARLLVHQRAATKDLWPSRWDAGVGGVVRAGESYELNARREAAEEIGVALTPLPIGHCRFVSDECRVHGGVFVAIHDGPFAFTDGEVARVEWLDLADLDRELSDRAWCDDTVTAALPLLRSYLAEARPTS